MSKQWECPDCGYTTETHANKEERPFCNECDWRDAVLTEMREVDAGVSQ